MTAGFHPAIGLAEAVAVAAVLTALALWLAWRATRELPRARRALLIGLRAAGLLLLAFIWLNPGHWRAEQIDQRRDWLVLLDRSGSMRAEQTPGTSRWTAALQTLEALRRPALRGRIRVRSFSGGLESESEEPGKLVPDGQGTALGEAVAGALVEQSSGLAGIILLSDGRPTSRLKLPAIAQRAHGRGVPIHVVPFGAGGEPRDLVLTASPRQVIAFAGQPVKISARLENHGLGAIKPAVVLSGPDGTELARQAPALTNEASEPVTFELPAGQVAAGEYTLRVDPQPNEQRLGNNADAVRVQVLTSRLRVLLLEGAPYWDSKFLAQLLRQQSAMEVLAVHRLNEDRYFRVEPGGAEPLASPDTVFPENAEGLARYDLIVFGKGAEGFLTPGRLVALQGFLRDHGGAVLFARGKPYAGQFPALAPLEPVEWGETSGGSVHFRPVADAAAGLFGAALPAADDKAWAALPPLEDVRNIAHLRPFARVLAEGTVEGRETRLPLLIVRRYGRGTVATLNADGLWRWDFRPEVREQGAVYQQFWVQLLAWCATWSEFRAGEDFAVRLRESSVEPGETVRAVIASRAPSDPEPHPRLVIRRAGAAPVNAAATALPAGEAGREWAAVFAPDAPGRYEIRVADDAHPEREQGGAVLDVAAPLQEADDLRPDVESLQLLARESGGRLFSSDDPAALAATLLESESTANRGKPHWEPLWTNWWMTLALGLTFGGEWWLRRREGLL